MSRTEQIAAVALHKGLYSSDISEPSLLPQSLRKAIGDRFFERDPATIAKADQKAYLLELKDAAISNGAKADWTQWLRLPHKDAGGNVVRKAHSENTMMQVFTKLYKHEQHILNERSFSEQQESQTVASIRDNEGPSVLSEEGEIPPTPDHDVLHAVLTPASEVTPMVLVDSPPQTMRVNRAVQSKRVAAMLERVEQNTLHRPAPAPMAALSAEEIVDFMARQVQSYLDKRQ